MITGLEKIAAKARCEPKLQFTSLAHHIDAERLWQSLCHIPRYTATGSDGQTVDEVKQDFPVWSAATLQALHNQGYRPPPVTRVYIPKPGKREKRPLGVPAMWDRALQALWSLALLPVAEATADKSSYGFRPYRGCHDAYAQIQILFGRKNAGGPEWVLDADIKGFFERCAKHHCKISSSKFKKIEKRTS